jgi:hypothetical protein
MNSPASGALAVEMQPHSLTQWVATFYPMVDTPAGRWANITWALHHHFVPTTHDTEHPPRWLEARSPDPDHPGYAGHRLWATQLALGYTAALAVYHAEAIEEPLPPHQAQQLRAGTVVVPAGQLYEWVLEDLQEDTSDLHG